MGRVVNRVHEQVGADGLGQAARARDVRERAECVRRRADGDDLRALVYFGLEVVPVERARLRVHADDAQDYTALAL